MASQQRKKGQGSEYQIKPKQKEKFRPTKVKEKIRKILSQKLETNQPQIANYAETAKHIADLIQMELKDASLRMPRYKYLVQVMLGQNKGQGVQVGGKCFWDSETDYVAQENFLNEQVYCVVMVYGVYLY